MTTSHLCHSQKKKKKKTHGAKLNHQPKLHSNIKITQLAFLWQIGDYHYSP